MTTQTFDVIIIGAGPVGENVADRIVQGGLTASAAVATEAAGRLFPSVFGIAAGGVRIVFADIEEI